MKEFIEKVGKFSGEQIVNPVLDHFRHKVEFFNLEIFGLPNLVDLKGKQFLMVSNHLMPVDKRSQQSQLSPDAFVLQKLVKEYNDQEMKTVSKCDDGWWAQNLYRYFQKYVQQPFGKGMIEGIGQIPVFKNPGTVNETFFQAINSIITEGKNPILIFPEGHWYEDFSPDHKLATGASRIAQAEQIPVLPVYISGARSWQPETDVKVAFGSPFTAKDMKKEEITETIRFKLTELQKQAQHKG